MEFIEKVFKFHLVTFCSFQCPMLTVLILFIQSKNPVIADCTDVKQNRQDAKNKCCTLLLTGIYWRGKQSGSISKLF